MRIFVSGIVLFLGCQLQALDRDVLLRKLSEPGPEWMHEQFREDLSPFSSELKEHYLDDVFSAYGDHYHLIRVQIRDAKLHFTQAPAAERHSVAPRFMGAIRKLHEAIPIPDIDFLISCDDTLKYNGMLLQAHSKDPIFCAAKDSNAPGILIPGWFALDGFVSERQAIFEGNKLYSSWSAKEPVLFFRGADTYPSGNSWEGWESFPRVAISFLSAKVPELIDAKLVGLHCRGRPHTCAAKHEEAARAGMMGNFVPLKDHPRYKYLADLDGNCASSPRLAAILHANCVVFKEITISKEWWYKTLKPFVHFIPFSSDLSDLLERLEWAKTHDEECRVISQNGQRLAAEVLNEEAIYEYFYRVLSAYAAKQTLYR
jgi:hypothetical protein